MKALPILSLAILLTSRAWSVENPIPTAHPADRYAALSEKAPFALATPAAPVVTPQASFAANWFVSGIARIGDADFVTIKARDQSTQFSLFAHETHPVNGVSVASVNWSETVGKSTVILQKGSETAKLEFNEMDLRGPQAAPTPQPGMNPSGVPMPQPVGMPPQIGTAPVGMPQPPGMPPQPVGIPRPGNMPVIVPAQATRQFPTPTANPNEVHRRVRIINQPK